MKSFETKKDDSINGPVFILGMNGSGTTMLADCLSNHPDLYIFPRETRVLPYFFSKIESYGDLSELSVRRKLADDIGKIDPFRIVNKHKPLTLEDNELKDPGFSGVINSIFMHFAKASGKNRWGEKSPMHLQHISLLAKIFPHAKFLHIYRDGRDVAQSFNRRWKKNPYRTIYRWKEVLKFGRSQGLLLGTTMFMEVKYEDLTEKPEQELKKICTFLNLEFHSAVCRTYGSMHSERHMDPAKRTSSIIQNSEKWKEYFSTKQIAALENIAGEYLLELGYATVTVLGDINPNPWKLKLWHVSESVKGTLNYFRKYGLNYAPMYFAKMFSTMKQDRTNYH